MRVGGLMPWLAVGVLGSVSRALVVETAVGAIAVGAGIYAGYNTVSCAVAECCVPGTKWITPNFTRESSSNWCSQPNGPFL